MKYRVLSLVLSATFVAMPAFSADKLEWLTAIGKDDVVIARDADSYWIGLGLGGDANANRLNFKAVFGDIPETESPSFPEFSVTSPLKIRFDRDKCQARFANTKHLKLLALYCFQGSPLAAFNSTSLSIERTTFRMDTATQLQSSNGNLENVQLFELLAVKTPGRVFKLNASGRGW